MCVCAHVAKKANDLKCKECGADLREEIVHVGLTNEKGELPPGKKQYTCMNEKCGRFNYPQLIEGLTLRDDPQATGAPLCPECCSKGKKIQLKRDKAKEGPSLKCESCQATFPIAKYDFRACPKCGCLKTGIATTESGTVARICCMVCESTKTEPEKPSTIQ